MSLADQIEIIGPIRLVAGHSFWVTFLILLGIMPGMHILLGIVGESRLIPLLPQKQFLSFIPGAFFLDAAVAMMLQVPLKDGPTKTSEAIYPSLLVAATVSLTLLLVGREIFYGLHPWRQILSPVGFYHSFIGGYGYFTYLILAVAVAVLTGADWAEPSTKWRIGVALVLFARFLLYVRSDGGRKFDPSETYIEGWNPIWRLLLRRR